MKITVEKINEIAIEAGQIIMNVYNDNDLTNQVILKSDESPLTMADKLSHAYISEQLKKLTPEIPIISEEGDEINYEVRKLWTTFWLVDPLDGTKEFISRNGEFTVNIALLENNVPVLGTIYIPATETLYFGDKENGAYKRSGSKTEKITSKKESPTLTAVGSRSHASKEEENFLAEYNIKEVIPVGSSLKFCLIAEGKADIYYRHNPTMEWDTAAGQAIVESSGGIVYNEEHEVFRYNKESLKNKSFICFGNVRNLQKTIAH